MNQATAISEGYVPFRGHRTWYRVYGDREVGSKLPLLCLHGGPGGCYDALETLRAVAETGRRAIFYDQLGCGNSDHVDDPSLWTVALFREEIDAVRQALGLDRIHLLGQSWGGMLAMEYMLANPSGVASLTIASSPASMPQWVAEANRLREDLPPEVQANLLAHERAGTTDSPEYQAAAMVFYTRHLCRLDPWPEELTRAFVKQTAYPQVYRTMNGPSEFHLTGTLRDWDIVDRLPEITGPTLITSGRYDEATPPLVRTIHEGIPGSEWVLFDDCSHTAHLEQPDLYTAVLGEFLDRIEGGGTSNGTERTVSLAAGGPQG